MVGIELGRVHCRRRVTSLALSVARWVHNSTMATFSEAPFHSGRPNFPGPVGSLGLSMVSLPIRNEGQALVRIRPDAHGLLTTSCHLLRRLFPALGPGTALTLAPPSIAVGIPGSQYPPHRSVRALSSAYGSYLGWLAAKRTPGQGWSTRGMGSQWPVNRRIRAQEGRCGWPR